MILTNTHYIDFIRHADAILPHKGVSDSGRQLSTLGISQAEKFAARRISASEHYDQAIASGIARTVETVQRILSSISKGCQYSKVSELFDPLVPNSFSAERQAAYQKIGHGTLHDFYAECPSAMIELFQKIEESRLRELVHRGANTLIVGHSVYTNLSILALLGDKATEDVKDMMMTNESLVNCCGYRLTYSGTDLVSVTII